MGRRERARGDPQRALVARGEVGWLELEDEGRRLVVVLTRDEAVPTLKNVVVALVTRATQGLRTEVDIGPGDGMPIDCVISLDNIRIVPRALLTEPITTLDADKLDVVGGALALSAGC